MLLMSVKLARLNRLKTSKIASMLLRPPNPIRLFTRRSTVACEGSVPLFRFRVPTSYDGLRRLDHYNRLGLLPSTLRADPNLAGARGP